MKQEARENHVANPGERDSFAIAEAAAREVLRERGFNNDQIDAELSRAHREETD